MDRWVRFHLGDWFLICCKNLIINIARFWHFLPPILHKRERFVFFFFNALILTENGYGSMKVSIAVCTVINTNKRQPNRVTHILSGIRIGNRYYHYGVVTMPVNSVKMTESVANLRREIKWKRYKPRECEKRRNATQRKQSNPIEECLLLWSGKIFVVLFEITCYLN